MHFYKTSVAGTFGETITAVRQFARADAARLRLRDSLRAQEIVRDIKTGSNIFIEAGMIHYSLFLKIWKNLKDAFNIRPFFLNRIALIKEKSYQGLYSPGDLLTLGYIFHPSLNQYQWESLLAARSIVYSKIIQKEEHPAETDSFFHLKNESDCIKICRRLSVDDCHRLYPMIRRRKTVDSYDIVKDYITKRP